ncbi:histidine kinase [Burkholderia pseudomallei]|nr:histidine kinase [Burkholderia pseudomallei]CAJ8198667.1 histidine kinase [Burkholderia pseudomallei]
MVIKINARVLLELGAELISSDQIALYELVKNSLDAKASRIEVNVHVAMQRSEFLRIVEGFERSCANASPLTDGQLREALEEAFEAEVPEESRQAFLRVALAGASSKRLDALWSAYSQFSWVQVSDDGSGMSMEELDTVYLTIGTPHRLLEREKDTSRTVLGEKGIGRLSAVRLGDRLLVHTSKKGEPRLNCLQVDWSLIKANPRMALNDFPAQPVLGDRKADRALQGTVITINNLMSDWSESKLAGLASTDFAKLVDPFLDDIARPNIHLRYNGRKVVIPAFEFRQLAYAHAKCTARFGYDKDGEPELTGEVIYKSYARTKKFTLAGVHLRSALALKGKRPKKNQPAPALLGSLVHGLAKLGPFEMEAHWFNRQKLRLDKPSGYEEALSWLTRWGGGLLLYRDHYRVYPYAETRDDWLDLDGVALATSGYKMNRKQLVGAVRISSRKNPRLLDQTNREGLRDTEEKAALIVLLRHVLIAEFKSFLNAIEGEQDESAAKEFPQLEKRLEEAQKEALKQVQLLRGRVTAKEDIAAINTLLAKMADMAEAWERSKQTVQKYERDMDSYLHLAGVGLMTEFIFHELARISASSLKVLQDYRGTNSAESARLRTLKEQLITLDKRIRVLDPLSTPGRQRKESFDLVSTIKDVSEAHSAQWVRHEILCDLSGLPGRTVDIKAVKGQFIQILENLISNSVYWMNLQAEVKPFKRRIEISIDVTKKIVLYSDNGPGIPEDRGDEVFNAFFSTKPAGEGRGMGLYIAKKLAEGNGLTLELSKSDENRVRHGFIIGYEGALQ